MFTRAMPPLPFERAAATPTMAQSWARRLNFWKPHAVPGVFGTRISVSSSSAARADSRNPVKKSLAAITRSPLPPSATNEASRASSVAGRSDAGSAWATEPPMVPRWRTCGSPDVAGGDGQDRHLLLEQVGGLDVAVAGQGADGDVVAGVADVGQVA